METAMARPMVLMQKELLTSIYDKHQQGVPVLALIRKYNLYGRITAPTLTKLLSYYKAMDKSNGVITKVIHDSLFPLWLTMDKSQIVSTSPVNYTYTGSMPLGNWVELIIK